MCTYFHKNALSPKKNETYLPFRTVKAPHRPLALIFTSERQERDEMRQCRAGEHKRVKSSKQGVFSWTWVLHIRSIDLWGQVILSEGPSWAQQGGYKPSWSLLLDDSSSPPPVTTNNVSTHCQMSPGGERGEQNCPQTPSQGVYCLLWLLGLCFLTQFLA